MENSTASSQIVNRHFFQPLLPGFHSHLKIPMAFFSKHIEGKINEGNGVVKLRSDASSMTWEVKLDGQRLTQGWEKFATAHNLRIGDIVIFRHEGALLFHVTCFGPSCCEIQFDDDDVNGDNDEDDGDDDDDDVIELSSGSEKNQNTAHKGSSSSDRSSFVRRVTSSNLNKDMLFLPKDFSRYNGLMNRRCKISLLNEDRKRWGLFLTCHKTRVYLRTGWRKFCRENRKRVDDLLTFELVQRGKRPVLQLISSVRNQKSLRASSSSSSSFSPSSTDQCRFLTLTLTPASLKSYTMFLPAAFVRENGIQDARKITLVDQYGIKRTTSLKLENPRKRLRLGKEWREFCKVNEVKTGESFKLELIINEDDDDTATHLLKFCSKLS